MSAMEYTQKSHRISFLYYFKEISALVCMPRWQPHDVRLMLTAIFHGPILEEENRNLPQKNLLKPVVVAYFDVFSLGKSNFEEQLHVWRKDVSEINANNNDLLAFAKPTKVKFTDLIEKKNYQKFKLKNVKVSFGLTV